MTEVSMYDASNMKASHSGLITRNPPSWLLQFGGIGFWLLVYLMFLGVALQACTADAGTAVLHNAFSEQ